MCQVTFRYTRLLWKLKSACVTVTGWTQKRLKASRSMPCQVDYQRVWEKKNRQLTVSSLLTMIHERSPKLTEPNRSAFFDANDDERARQEDLIEELSIGV